MTYLEFISLESGDIVLYYGELWRVVQLFNDGYIKLVDPENTFDYTEVYYGECIL